MHLGLDVFQISIESSLIVLAKSLSVVVQEDVLEAFAKVVFSNHDDEHGDCDLGTEDRDEHYEQELVKRQCRHIDGVEPGISHCSNGHKKRVNVAPLRSRLTVKQPRYNKGHDRKVCVVELQEVDLMMPEPTTFSQKLLVKGHATRKTRGRRRTPKQEFSHISKISVF